VGGVERHHGKKSGDTLREAGCSVVSVSRRVARYRLTRPDDAPLRVRLRALAAERRCFGYRRLDICWPAKA
jgi:putative transposase